jgi:YfiH family protein
MKRAEYLESPLLRAAGFRHAFFTRRGGVSAGPYESLNFSFTVGDREANVSENLKRAAEALGVAPDRLYFLSQVHGHGLIVLKGNENWRRVRGLAGDALASDAADLACCVRVADCVPLLVGDRISGVVAAAHAGWRGTVAGVVGATIRRVCELAGPRADLVAAIGPHISVDAFEVADPVAQQLAAASTADGVIDRDRGPRPHVDLGRIVRAQLCDAGVPAEAIEDIGGCTVGEPARFFSYRRDGPHSGRHRAAIVPRAGP